MRNASAFRYSNALCPYISSSPWLDAVGRSQVTMCSDSDTHHALPIYIFELYVHWKMNEDSTMSILFHYEIASTEESQCDSAYIRSGKYRLPTDRPNPHSAIAPKIGMST